MSDRETRFFKGAPNVLLTCWKDTKMVALLMNCYTTTKTTIYRRPRKKDLKKKRSSEDKVDYSKKEAVLVPQSVADYTSFMKGVGILAKTLHITAYSYGPGAANQKLQI